MARRLFSTFILVALAGCAAPMRLEGPSHSPWVSNRGGFERGRSQARATEALGRLTLAEDGRPTVRVLATDDLGAWSWPDGRIAVTRGLVDAVGDAELVAALAHEIGHLVLGRHLDAGQGLPRTGHAADEQAADRIACALLDRSGIPDTSLTTLLGVLHDDALDSDQRARLGARIAALGTGNPITPPDSAP